MTIRDRVGQQEVRRGEDMFGGKGKYEMYGFFLEQSDPRMFFVHIAFEPGGYGGYHRHEIHDTILYVLSGRAEHYQDGERCMLGRGDALLIKSGHPHTVRNIGEETLEILEFATTLPDEQPEDLGITPMPLPADIADWE